MEPNNAAVKAKLNWAIEQREKKIPTVPSTIGEELTFNPFMRVHEASVQQHAEQTDPILCMQTIRKEKDSWKPT